MNFFTSPDDLRGWIKSQESADTASNKILEIIGKDEEQDVLDTCQAIFKNENDNIASQVLFDVLAKHQITQIREGSMSNKKLKKEAQLMRGEAPLYQSMPLRVCPKLPFSQGKRLISTYNCRHWCLDSIVFDDDPLRVYCAEALWRRHVMDKFSREFKDKDGKWVGGYINERFEVFHDDGGNPMELANEERTRKPRPHQYSTERRLSEGRGEKTYDITASTKKFVKVASVEISENDNQIYQIFSDIIEMRESSLSNEDIIGKVADHYNVPIQTVASIHKIAIKQLKRHSSTIYSCEEKMRKKSQAVIPEKSTLITQRDAEVVSLANGQKTTLRMETPVVMITNGDDPTFEIVDGYDAGIKFKLANKVDLRELFAWNEANEEKIQDAAEELGLNETTPATSELNSDFAITEV